MSRTIEEIYDESVKERNKYLELTELHNDSKMSIMNAITWITSAMIHSFEVIMDVFTLDLVKVFNNRINGTPAYYSSALLKWQYGDELEVNEDGTSFRYPRLDKSKCLITHVSYQELYNSHYQDNMLVLKVATGEKEDLTRLPEDQLQAARKYINQIKFAGVKCVVVSRKGDVLVPKLTVYHDGGLTQDELYTKIEEALANFINNTQFNSELYAQKVIDAIQKVEHVTDVFIASPEQGVFLAQYNDDDELEPLKKVERKSYMSSGYLKESTRKDQEESLPTFREAIVLKLENAE